MKVFLFTVKLLRRQLNVSIGDFSRVPFTPAWLAIVVDETTSCSSSASNTLHDKTLQIIKELGIWNDDDDFTFVINVD